MSVSPCVCVLKRKSQTSLRTIQFVKTKGRTHKNKAQKYNKNNKNEKEMKWIEKIEKFYLLQVL